ncbi:MAG TPA: N-acyl-D-glucosamine 2-epimerase, partial [Candidatus Ozemobacteraceae bacterium]|nr:N-acyl-D-glucosamine 2-epimerase [Candidatus Ozemobacteraceae bacterium]
LKIAWNLTRLYNGVPDPAFLLLARKIGRLMPQAGRDVRRGGWYDVLERRPSPGRKTHSFVWHDRKTWWQQEQAILCYLIQAGCLDDADALQLARESSAFYNAWFLDHNDGGVFFSVLANGIPYLVGSERQKGSHSMSGYHAFELCYLAAVYTNLLVTGKPLDLYFRPMPGSFGGCLRVAPDFLPKGRVILQSVEIDGRSWTDFDSLALTVHLPKTDRPVKVKVRLAPASCSGSRAVFH